ncbi:MAG: hypothetical protein R2810_08015 [Flavobacteriales bacterium]
MSKLNGLVGQIVLQVSDDITTYLPINSPTPFPEGGQAVIVRVINFGQYTLNIANPTRLSQAGVALDRYGAMIGRPVTGVEETEQFARIDFGPDLRLEIDLRDESFTGPEAMVLYGPDYLIVVWN